MRRLLVFVICMIGPIAALLIAAPVALLPFEAWRMADERSPADYLLLASPIYLAVAAAPGYVACALELGTAFRWWIRISMATAILCSIVGLWAATLMSLFGPPSLVSLVCAALLWWRFERNLSRVRVHPA